LLQSFVLGNPPLFPEDGTMYKFINFADNLSAWFGKAFAWLIMFMTFVSFIMYGTLFMVGGAYTLGKNGHVRGDFLYRNWKPSTQARVDFILYFLFFFPGVLALAVTGFKYAARSVRYGEVSINSPAGIPIFQFKAIIVLAGVLLVIQGIAQVLRCVHCMRHGSWYETKETDEVEETEVILKRQQQQPSREQ
jgi:TRAP-type mannitol/chloroaromatic compound transport system permease small subunit